MYGVFERIVEGYDKYKIRVLLVMFPQELAGLNITLQTELDAAAAKAKEEEALKAKEEADAAEEKVRLFSFSCVIHGLWFATMLS